MARKTSSLENIVNNTRTLANLTSTVVNRFDLFGQQRRAAEARTMYLRQKYRDEGTVQALLTGQYWIGQSADQLVDAIGQPAGIDQKALATRHRQIWKYWPTGINRYQLRVTLDNGQITGWDSKN